MNKKVISLVGGLGLALAGFCADVVPTAYVSEAGRAVTVGGERVELDAANCFDAWKDGVKPADEAARAAVYAQWGAYANWSADFVVTFDRAIEAESVSLYGQAAAFGSDWFALPIAKDLAPNVPYCILKDGIGLEEAIPYVGIAEEIVRFVCGVKNHSAANVGTTMTIELRLSDPEGVKEPVTLARRTCTFCVANKPNWFDARIQEYKVWPDDAAKAVKGEWQATEGTLAEQAAVKTDGVLSVDADRLRFLAARSRTLDSRLRFSFDADLNSFDADALPAVDPNWKGSVICVAEASGLAYYGLAKDGEANVWKKLEGPAPTGGTVNLAMTIRRKAGQSVVRYMINGTDYLLNGKKDIPVLASGEVKGVALGGEGTLTSLSAETVSGMVMSVK